MQFIRMTWLMLLRPCRTEGLADETGLYSKITDEAVETGKGKLYSESQHTQDLWQAFSFPDSSGEMRIDDDDEDTTTGDSDITHSYGVCSFEQKKS